MKRRVLCPHCDRRRLRNAVRLFRVGGEHGVGRLLQEVVLGCRLCLARMAWKRTSTFANLFVAARLGASIWKLAIAAAANLGWIPGAFVRGQTKWLRAALGDAEITYREFLTGFGDRGPRSPVSQTQRIEVARSLVTVLRTVAVSLGPGTSAKWNALRGHVRFLLDAEPDVFAVVDPGEKPLGPPELAQILNACDVLRERMDPESRTLALHMMLELITTGDRIRPEAVARIHDIALECGIDPEEAERILGAHTDSDPEPEPDPASDPASDPGVEFDEISDSHDPRVVLGVPPGATASEIRRRYIALVHQHHPDRHAHLGRAFEDAANRRLKIINEAYRQANATIT